MAFTKMEGRDEMTKTSISLQDLRRKIYRKAKAEKRHRFWGMFVHVVKPETLQEAYRRAKKNNGAPGIDGVTFAHIEAHGRDAYLADLREALLGESYRPLRNRSTYIPKETGGQRKLSIPALRDRVIQGAVALILEPVFEADFQDGSYGYRPKRTAHEAVHRVAEAIVERKTRVIDLDLENYFGTVRHDVLLGKIAERIDDPQLMKLLRQILKASGRRGVPQGGPLSPLLSNIYLNEVDSMLEKAKRATRNGPYTYIEYARFADDLVVLVDEYRRWDWLLAGARRRLGEELDKLGVAINEEKTRVVDLRRGEHFRFLGFEFREAITRAGKKGVMYVPTMRARTKLLRKLKDIFRRSRSQPIRGIIDRINPIVRGWVNYFRIGTASRRFGYIRDWVEKKIRRHLMSARKRKGFGWNRWSRRWLYDTLGLFDDYRVRYYQPASKVGPAG
jgi:RNA-directed DNA polymerase